MKYCDLRKNSITGHIESDGYTESSLTFAEWWNGEGIDFTLCNKGFDDQSISLHMYDIEMIALAGLLTGMIDMDELLTKEKECKEIQKKRDDERKKFSDSF